MAQHIVAAEGCATSRGRGLEAEPVVDRIVRTPTGRMHAVLPAEAHTACGLGLDLHEMTLFEDRLWATGASERCPACLALVPI